MKYTYTALAIHHQRRHRQSAGRKKVNFPRLPFVFNLIITDAVSWLIYNYIATLHHL